MSFNVSAGISKSELNRWLEEARVRLGSFPDGRINYKHANIAPIVMCTLKMEDNILIVKRGYHLADAQGYWSTVNGFIDEPKPIKKICQQEVREETGVVIDLSAIKVGESYTLRNPKEKRSYIVFPCLVILSKTPTIVIDHEHTSYLWIKREQVSSYHILEDLPYAIDRALSLERTRF